MLDTVCPAKLAERLHLNPSISPMCRLVQHQMAPVRQQIFTAREDTSRLHEGFGLGLIGMIQSTFESNHSEYIFTHACSFVNVSETLMFKSNNKTASCILLT